MMCFVRGWVGEWGNLAGDWKAASFVVFTAAAVLPMSEPSKGRFFLPFEELSLALRSTESAPLSLQQKMHPGDARQSYSWASNTSHPAWVTSGEATEAICPLLLLLLSQAASWHHIVLHSAKCSSQQVTFLHCTLLLLNIAFQLASWSPGCAFSSAKLNLETSMSILIKKSPSSPCTRIRKTFAGHCERCQVLGLVHIIHFIYTLLFRSPCNALLSNQSGGVSLTGITMVILVLAWLEVI